MYDLTAQVTSSLLPFSGVTVEALGEDEIRLDCVLQGNFTLGRSGLAWLACGPHLEVVHALTGERLSAYCFSGGGEHPPNVLAAKDFSWLKRFGLLVGLEEAEGSVLCLYDLGLSRVVKAVAIPGRITVIEPLVSYGGASTSTQHLHQSLRWFFGIAAVVTDLGHVLLVDLCLDDLSCSQNELEASDLQVVTKTPADIPRLREVGGREGRHLCLQLSGPGGVCVTALQYIPRTNQLAVGFSDGHLHLWNMKTLKKEYHSQLDGGRVPVYAFTFQEPENDPRNCCYLWAIQSSQNLEGDLVSLHLLQLAFSERKCLASGKILYEGLEYCEERYSQDLSGTSFPLRAQATNTRLLSCQTIEKFRAHPDRDDNMNEVASPDTSLSVFSWQVKTYGQGTPSTYIGVFDINRWYHAQMPDSLRTGESLQNCPYLAVWSLDPVIRMVSSHTLLDVVVHERSLSRGLPFTCPPPEQYFNPTTYNFDATCLFNSGIVHLTCSGHQKETLGFLKKAAPCSSDGISTCYSYCLMSGLLSSRLADTQPSSLSQEEQLDAILSTAVETSSLGLITGCIKQWTAEEQPGSALNLRYILDWAWNKVVHTKEDLDGICAPLFDSSSNFTDPQTLQLLQHSQRLLSNLSAIFHCLLSEAQELTQKGLAGLVNKNVVASLISKYAQVVLWFCRTGLLPEGSDEDALQISRPYYTHSVISNYYTIRREELTRLSKGKWSADCLMIDGLVGQCGERLNSLWRRDEGGTGQYPPPTLHALLDIYLLENTDEAAKHAIVIYLLLDVMYSFPNKDGASVESFPTAFAIPIGLVKLVQGLWLLDHHDHQSSFELLLHPAASQFHFEWQHERVLHALMCQGQQPVALRYFHATKPPITCTSQAKLFLSVLLHNRCLIEAWSLLRQHSNRLNIAELMGFLYESCQEMGLMKELLKLPLGVNEQECLEKFLQGTGGLQNRELLMVHYLQQANYIPALQLNHSLKMNLVNERDPKLKERSNSRNSILDQYGKILPRIQRKLVTERAKPYQHPSIVHREVTRPQPLSAITKRLAHEKVMSRAGFISSVLTKIEEVWLGKDDTPDSFPARSPRSSELQRSTPKSPLGIYEPFLGTPITMTSKRKSRLIDLVVHPSRQTPQALLTPPRPPASQASSKSFNKAPELTLLQTPQVVKRARALAASGPVFPAFTPQSILRSSLRPTPVATPSASPGRSVTPPLRSKESRITFVGETEIPETEKGIRWTNGVAAESEINLINRSSAISKATCKTWSSGLPEEEESEENGLQVKFSPPDAGVPSPQLRFSERDMSSTHEVCSETNPPAEAQGALIHRLDTSQTSVRSTDTTLEYFDAPQLEDARKSAEPDDDDDDDGVVILNINPLARKEEQPGQSIHVSSVDAAQKEESAEEVVEGVPTPEGENEEKDFESERLEDQNMLPRSKVEETSPPDHEEPLATTKDLTEFVQQHLFGEHTPTSLTHSEIHNASLTRSESSEETSKEKLASGDHPVFITQKSTVSVTSSDPTAVVSLNDSEELSSPASEEEHDDEEEEEEESSEGAEEEDSGSEVEIIEEVQGNGRMATLQPTSDFMPQEHAHFLSEQQAAELSLIAASADMKVLDENMEGEVVMVRLGSDGGEMDPEENLDQGSFMELKPASTLLVPFELIGEPQSLADTPELQLPELQSSHVTGAHSGFTLMLDMNEYGDNEAEMPSVENNLQPPEPSSLPDERNAAEDNPEIISLGSENTVPPLFEVLSYEDKRSEVEKTDSDAVVEFREDQPAKTHVGDAEQAESNQLAESASAFVSTNQLPKAAHDEYSVQFGDQPTLAEDVQILAQNDEEKCLLDVIVAVEEEEEPAVAVEEEEEEEEEPAVAVEEPALVSEEEPAAVEEPALVSEMELAAVEEPALVSEGEPALVSEGEPALVSEEEPAAEEEKPAAVEEPAVASEEEPVEMVAAIAEEEEPAAAEVVGPAVAVEEELMLGEKEVSNIEQTMETEIKSEMEEITVRRTRSRNVKQKDSASDFSPNKQSVSQPAKISNSKSKTPSTPTRRMTRARNVTIISPSEEADEPELIGPEGSVGSASLSRTPTRGKRVQEVKVTPRRSARKTQQVLFHREVELMDHESSVASKISPVKRAQRTRNSRHVGGGKEISAPAEADMKHGEHQEEESVQTKVSRRKSSKTPKTPTPSKSKTTRTSTPRRSNRRILSSSDVESSALDVVKEVNEPEELDGSPVRRSSRKMKSGLLPAQLEEDQERDKQVSGPGRTTRHSSRTTLNMFPQVKLVPVSLPQSTRKTRGHTSPETGKESGELESNLNRTAGRSSTRRATQRKLWDHPEEELPLLDSPLEVDSETPVADALMKRLKDEEEKREGGVIKKATRSQKLTRASADQVTSQPAGSKESEPSNEEHSFIHSPSRRRSTRAHRSESPRPSEEPEAPITRSRRRETAAASQDKTSSEDDHGDVELTAAVSRKKRAAKVSAKSQSVPVAEVELISPLPSPADAAPRTLRRNGDTEAPVTGRNLRRKRVMDSVFTRPVTRRKRL